MAGEDDGGIEGYADVLRASTGALSAADIGHLVFGSIATRELGRPRRISGDEDIDLYVRPPDAPGALEALEAAGFVTQEQDPSWIHKAKRAGVTVDVIFKAASRVYVDDEMLSRAVPASVWGVDVRLIPPEDLVVIKALLHDEHRAFDWFDAVSILDRTQIDWDYLLRRATAHGAHRVLSLLVFARSGGVDVPDRSVRELHLAAAGS